MGLKFNREDVQLGAIPVGMYPTDTTTTPAPLALPNRAVDWGVLPSGSSGQVLTVNADGSIGWAAGGGGSGSPGGTSGQIQYDNAGSFGGFTMSGDATLVTSTGVITVGAGKITYAKMQNTSAGSVLLGNPTGSAAAPSEITLGANLSFSGTTLVAAGGSGMTVGTSTVTSGTSTGLLYDNGGTLACTANLLVNDSTETITGTGNTYLQLASAVQAGLYYNSTNYVKVGNGTTVFSGYFQLNANDFGPASSGTTRTLGATLPFLSASCQTYYAQAADSASTSGATAATSSPHSTPIRPGRGPASSPCTRATTPARTPASGWACRSNPTGPPPWSASSAPRRSSSPQAAAGTLR